MRSWMLAGIRRGPGPLIGTVVASATAAVLTVAAISVAAADTHVPAGRLASASVVVAGSTNVTVTTGKGQDAQQQSIPLPAYRGVPAELAQRLAEVPGAASAAGETGFPNGTVKPGDVDLIAIKAKPGVSPDALASQIRAALHGGQGYTIATGTARGDVANLNAVIERTNGGQLGAALIVPIVLISLFVLASTTALAVNLRRRRFALLRAVGAAFGWYAVFVGCTGIVAGAGAGVVTLLTVTRAVTGAWTPYIPVPSALALVAVVATITVAAVMIPFRLMSRREPTLAAS